MLFPPFNYNTSRFERKFVVSNMEYHEIIQQIRNNSAMFSSLYVPRYINNIYFDTNDLDFFLDNVSGKGSRKKARIRWYGNLQGKIEKPVLEFKMREGMVGNKISFPLVPVIIDNQITREKLLEMFKNSDLPVWALNVVKMLSPTLMNRYHRQYFISFDNNFRLTVDSELSYFGIGNSNNSLIESHKDDNTIVELKYDNRFDGQPAAAVANDLPFRLTKSSKYVVGFELTHPWIPT